MEIFIIQPFIYWLLSDSVIRRFSDLANYLILLIIFSISGRITGDEILIRR